MPTRKTADATVEPITLAAAKLHLRVTNAAEDTLIETLITVVRQACESRLNRTLMTSEYTTTEADFGTRVRLPYGPLQSITSVKYLDTAGAEQTLSSTVYVVDQYAIVPGLELAYGQTWPTLASGRPDAVRVVYQAGYATDQPRDVPQPLVQWMLLQLTHYYENRSAVAAGGVQPLPYCDSLLDQFRVLEF